MPMHSSPSQDLQNVSHVPIDHDDAAAAGAVVKKQQDRGKKKALNKDMPALEQPSKKQKKKVTSIKEAPSQQEYEYRPKREFTPAAITKFSNNCMCGHEESSPLPDRHYTFLFLRSLEDDTPLVWPKPKAAMRISEPIPPRIIFSDLPPPSGGQASPPCCSQVEKETTTTSLTPSDAVTMEDDTTSTK